MQNDCNLVAYDVSHPMWATNQNGKGSNCRLDMQSDGNLVVYRGGDNRVMWASNTPGNPGAHLVAQWDGNVVLYRGDRPIWSTKTRLRRTAVSQRPSTGKFAGCAFARTDTKCIVAVLFCRAVYSCGMNPNNLSPIEKSETYKPCGGCFGFK